MKILKSLLNKTFLLSIAMVISIAFTGFSVESMYIDANGNVGIGTNTPADKLYIKDSNTAGGCSGLVIESARTAGPSLTFKSNATQGCNTWFLQGCGTTAGQGNGAFAIGSSVNPYVLIMNTSGNVGIGTTAPTEKLTVNGNLKVAGHIKLDGFIYSANGAYFLAVQGDGNLVMYRASDNKAIWSWMTGRL